MSKREEIFEDFGKCPLALVSLEPNDKAQDNFGYSEEKEILLVDRGDYLAACHLQQELVIILFTGCRWGAGPQSKRLVLFNPYPNPMITPVLPSQV